MQEFDRYSGKLYGKLNQLRRRPKPPNRQLLFSLTALDIALLLGVSLRTVYRWRKQCRSVL